MAGIYSNIKCLKKRKNVFLPTDYQSQVVNYFVNISTYKGLLLYHKLGAGKTCTSVLIADDMLRNGKINKVYVLTPGSLRVNWIDEYCKKCGDKFISKNFVFMTYNSNLQLKIKDYNFDNSLIIIDEAHNLINSVRNLSPNAVLIYKKIYESNCRVLLLTGTPIIQYIHEWSLMGNLLNPESFQNILVYNYNKPNIIEDAFDHTSVKNKQCQGIVSYYPGNPELYPTTVYREPIKCRMGVSQTKKYSEIFLYERETIARGPPPLNDPDYDIKHKRFIRCVKRIPSRKISNVYYEHPVIRQYNNIVQEIQYLNLLEAKYIEDKEQFREQAGFELINEIYNMQIEMLNIVKSRLNEYRKKIRTGNTVVVKHDEIQVELNRKEEEQNVLLRRLRKEYKLNLNFRRILLFDDPDILKQLNISRRVLTNKDGEEKDDDEDEDEENYGYSTSWIQDGLVNTYPNLLFDVSPKYVALLTNIISRIKTKHVIFTFFKTGIGIETLSAFFNKCGISYGVFSGDIDDAERRRIINLFNSVENRDGQLMNVLFITEAGAEGISLLEVNNMHIIESSPREHKLTQAIGRVARIYSHINMPKDRQYVNIWRYWSLPYLDKSKSPRPSQSKIVSIDEFLYNQGKIYTEGKDVFIQKLIQNSIENNPPNPKNMPQISNYGYDLSGSKNRFYEIVDKNITDTRFDKPNTYVVLPFTTSSIKIPEQSQNFLNRFPNIQRKSGYYREQYENTIWATLETRNEPGTYIVVNNKNINVIFAFIQQTIRIPKKIIDPLQPDNQPEIYKDRFINIEKVLREITEELPADSTIIIPSSIGTNGEAQFMTIIQRIINDVAKTNTNMNFQLYMK